MKQEIINNLTTKYVGRNIIFYDTIESTQIEAKKLASVHEVPDGTLVVANMQTKGIGTNDRIWYTKEGENITFTLVLYPECNIKKIDNLTIIIAECIIKAIKKLYNLSLDMKYPNDIMYKGRKLAGILTQSVTNKTIVKQLLIGIGINVNETSFGNEIEDIATSLQVILGKECSRENIIAQILNIFEEEYLKIIYLEK